MVTTDLGRTVRRAILLTVVPALLGFAGPATTSASVSPSPCYYGSTRDSGQNMYVASAVGRFLAGVTWKIGYTCTGEPYSVKVTQVSWRIYFPDGGLDSLTHYMSGASIVQDYDHPETTLQFLSTTQYSCKGSPCTIQHTWNVNVEARYGNHWRLSTTCLNCSIVAPYSVTMNYYWVAGTWGWTASPG